MRARQLCARVEGNLHLPWRTPPAHVHTRTPPTLRFSEALPGHEQCFLAVRHSVLHFSGPRIRNRPTARLHSIPQTSLTGIAGCCSKFNTERYLTLNCRIRDGPAARAKAKRQEPTLSEAPGVLKSARHMVCYAEVVCLRFVFSV